MYNGINRCSTSCINEPDFHVKAKCTPTAIPGKHCSVVGVLVIRIGIGIGIEIESDPDPDTDTDPDSDFAQTAKK